MSEILEQQTLDERIVDHLKSWINGMNFTKLLNVLNANSDYLKVTKGQLIINLARLKEENRVRKYGNGIWIDVRGRNGRHGSGKGMQGVHETWNSKGRRDGS